MPWSRPAWVWKAGEVVGLAFSGVAWCVWLGVLRWVGLVVATLGRACCGYVG